MSTLSNLILIDPENNSYVVPVNKDFHTKYGVIRMNVLQEAMPGQIVTTPQGAGYRVSRATTKDLFVKMKRGPAIVLPKDSGRIITETGIGSASKVFEAGAGTGYLGCTLAQICSEVVSYEFREEFYKIALHNRDLFGANNYTISLKDVYQGIEEKDFDVVIFDLPEPWRAFEHAERALKHGGQLALYLPTIVQVMQAVESLEHFPGMMYTKTLELAEREWVVQGKKVRPSSQGITHTAFLVFIRKL